MVAFTKVKSRAALLAAASVSLMFVAARAEESSPAVKTESTKVVAKAESAPKADTVKTNTAKTDSVDGKELFNREWQANDSRAKGGDGLGPVFNDSSCVACHSLGGSGGGGPASKNVDIITAFANPIGQPQPMVQQNIDPEQPVEAQPAPSSSSSASLPAAMINAFVQGVTGQAQTSTPRQRVVIPQPRSAMAGQPITDDAKAALVAQQKAELSKIHPGFLSARSVVLHHFSTDEKYAPWRLQMLGQNFGFGQGGGFSGGGFNGNFVINGGGTLMLNSTVAVASQDVSEPVTEQSQPTEAAVQPTISADSGQIAVTNLSQQAGVQMAQLQMAVRANSNSFQRPQTQVGNFAFVHSQRNATALFGDGLIDKIPDSVLTEQATKEAKDSPETQGRVSKVGEGKIGRFGWKAQKESLYEFAMTACAVELGLEVPNHPQAGMPLNPKYKAKGNDMDQAECDALVAYLSNLPAPVQRIPTDKKESATISAGEKYFAAVGCTNCHSAKLGEVAGIYSDLLLHDMGQELGDAGNYGSFVPDTPEEEQQNEPIPSLTAQHEAPQVEMVNGRAVVKKPDTSKVVGAMRLEWRTPPLWGVRDSGPYLHDGRAETLEQAIAFHGGQGAKSAQKFFLLKPEEKQQMIVFLKSLTAPEQGASAE